MQGLTKRQKYEILWAQLDQDWQTFYPQYKDLNDYILPSRARFFISDNNRGDRRNNKIYDPTAYLASRTLASGMMAGITSPARNWKRLTTQDQDMMDYGPVKEWLHLVDQRMSTYFAKSNLYNVLPVIYQDLGTFGTAAFSMEEDAQSVSTFYAHPIGTYRLAKDRLGRVNVFARRFRLTVRQLVEEFGIIDEKTGQPDWSNFSISVKNLWDRSNYETWVDLVHIVSPNMDYRPNKMDSKFKKFSSCYYEFGTVGPGGNVATDGILDDRFLREKGYDYFPVLAPRWQVTGQDVYGTDCPGMAVIGDVKQLQHGERRGAQAIDKMINPSMLASAGLKTSKASIVSGDITYVDDAQRDIFRPSHEIKIDISQLEAKQEQIRQRIKRGYYEDLILMLSNLETTGRTATEINERKEEKLLAIGPVLEQLNQDVLNPLVDNNFYLMNKQGLLPPPPQELAGQDLKVEYISIMAQAQKAVGLATLDRYLQMASTVIQIHPDSALKFDFDQVVNEYGDSLGIAPKLIRPDDKVAELRAQQQQAQAAQAKMAALQQASQTARNLSSADMSGDNALSRLIDQGKAGQSVPQAV